MSEKSAISWTDSTWNPVTGCTQIPGAHGAPSGCDNCYAKRLIDTRMSKNPKSVRFGHPFEEVMLHVDRLMQPVKWKRPRRIFVNSLSDLWHPDVEDDYIRGVFGVMANSPQHIFQVLTKRPERMQRWARKYYDTYVLGPDFPFPNVWLGTSISTMADAWRAAQVRNTPAAVRFLSLEPLLAPLEPTVIDGMDWVIVGGESGPGHRPMDLSWARDLHAWASAREIYYFFKQVSALRPTEDMIPRDLLIREYPR